MSVFRPRQVSAALPSPLRKSFDSRIDLFGNTPVSPLLTPRQESSRSVCADITKLDTTPVSRQPTDTKDCSPQATPRQGLHRSVSAAPPAKINFSVSRQTTTASSIDLFGRSPPTTPRTDTTHILSRAVSADLSEHKTSLSRQSAALGDSSVDLSDRKDGRPVSPPPQKMQAKLSVSIAANLTSSRTSGSRLDRGTMSTTPRRYSVNPAPKQTPLQGVKVDLFSPSLRLSSTAAATESNGATSNLSPTPLAMPPPATPRQGVQRSTSLDLFGRPFVSPTTEMVGSGDAKPQLETPRSVPHRFVNGDLPCTTQNASLNVSTEGFDFVGVKNTGPEKLLTPRLKDLGGSASENLSWTPRQPHKELTHRQRNQLYMHSTISDDCGAWTHSRTSVSDHDALMDHTGANQPKEAVDMTIPHRRDLKQTLLHGHDVATPLGLAAGRQTSAQPAEGLNVIKSDDLDTVAIPHEVWETSTALAWDDPRIELLTHRAKTRRSASAMDAGQRKAMLLSSEVLGSTRRGVEKDVRRCPRTVRGPEIRAVSFMGTFSSDTRLDPHHLQESSYAARTGGADVPNVARKRKEGVLACSDSSMFACEQEERTSGINSARVDLAVATDEFRRRTEKNYSDLFEMDLPMRQTDVRKFEAADSGTIHTFDARTAATSARRLPLRVLSKEAMLASPSPQTQTSAGISCSIEEDRPPFLTVAPSSPRQPLTEAQIIDQMERTCGGGINHVSLGGEVARRVRERRINRRLSKEGGEAALGDTDTSHLTAVERMQSQMASGQMQLGMGAALQTHHSPQRSITSMRLRSAPSSPESNAPAVPKHDNKGHRVEYMKRMTSDHFHTYRIPQVGGVRVLSNSLQPPSAIRPKIRTT